MADNKTVMLKIRTDDGIKKLWLRLGKKAPPPTRQPAPTIAAYRSPVPPSGGPQNIYATIIQAEGIRTGILTPVQGMPAGGAQFVQAASVSPLMGAAVITVKRDEKPQKPLQGITIPQITETVEVVGSGETSLMALRMLKVKYPLIPSRPKQGETVFAYADIYFDNKRNELVYNVVEPQLDEKSKKLVEEVKQYAQEKIDINFAQVRKKEAIGRLEEIVEQAMNYFKVRDQKTRETIKYYISRDFIGLEKIEPILNDRNIEDISCDGADIPLYVYHRDPRLGSMRTNIVFNNKDELDMFVNKVAERCGKVISVARPLLDAALPDGSRVQATLGSDIARRGSNFTIRMFTEKPLTPVELIKFGTCDLRMMAFFWFLVEHGSSVLVCGGTATGKTSLLNVLSLFIKPQMKIVSIEDTPELRLPHAHWVPEVARSPIAEEGKVDMFELLRESLRQRPDYIVVGEVRGKEAYVLFQQMAVGHPGMSTLHADSFQRLVDRLTTPPISLPSNLLQNLDLIVFIKRVKQERKYKRRITSVIEVVGFDKNTKALVTNEVFVWDPKTDMFTVNGNSVLLKKIAESTGVAEASIQEEIKKRVRILKWLVNKNITDYKKIGDIFNIFYTAPEFLLQRIEGL